MKNILKNTAFALLLIQGGMLLSCEKEIDSDIPPIDPFISVASTFAPDSTWKIWVGKSAHILDDQGPGTINDAVVEIYEEGTLLESITASGFIDGFYWGTTTPTEGRNYSLKVSAPGFADVTAVSRTPVAVPVLTTVFKDSVFSAGYDYFEDEITFTFQDPAGEKNYYGVTLAYRDTLDYLGDTMIFWSTIYFTNPDPNAGNTFGETQLLSDALFDGRTQTFSMRFDSYFGSFNKDLFLILTSMTEDYYRFQLTYDAYQNSYGNPFSEPVQLHNNLVGGVGIFAGCSNSVKTVW
jgi:hypothetical protein